MTSQSLSASLRRRLGLLLTTAVLTGSLAWPAASARAQSSAPASGFVEVAQLPVTPGDDAMAAGAHNAGWLIINPVTRRGYQVFEARHADPQRGGVNSTVLQSFDLDTLKMKRRVVLAGLPVTGGAADPGASTGTLYAGDIVHAVDEKHGRLYLGMSQVGAFDDFPEQALLTGSPPDSQRPLSRFVAIDEAKMEAGAPDFAAQFHVPVEQARLRAYWLLGMAVSRHHVPANEPGRVLALFAQPQPAGNVNVTPLDHTLAQWDPSNLTFTASAALATDPQFGLTVTPGEAQIPLIASAGPARRLEPCGLGSIVGQDAFTRSNYQWGILATKAAVWTACTIAGVVRTDVDPETGHLVLAGGQEPYPLSASIADVFVDEGGERVLAKAVGKGQTWWVFDTHKRRVTGAIAAKCSDFGAMASGIDPTTGRLYALLPDDICQDTSGLRDIPVRGGFAYSDTRLEPAPPMENARPDLAWPAIQRIAVDPVKRQIFVRRNPRGFGAGPKFPGTQSTHLYAEEPFFRVLKDNVPITEQPKEQDDSVFTTDVDEDPALTRASYLGSGQGSGSRVLLIGGLEAATFRNQAIQQSPCGKDNREILAGSVGGVEVSDLSVAAESASLDADGRTQDHLGTPVNKCRVNQWDDENNPWHHESSPTEGRPLPETDEAAFDQEIRDKDGDTVDENGDGIPDRDGVNYYRATCTGDPEKKATLEATAPEGSAHSPTGERLVPRDQFRADVTCDQPHGSAEGKATGAISISQLDDAQATAGDGSGDPAEIAPQAATVRSQVPGDPVRVGYAHSEVKVEREIGKGVTVKVDSIARNVVVPGFGTIALVRGEATVTATGRPGGAEASYSRTICGVDFPGLRIADCWDERRQGDLEQRMNESMNGKGKVRFRPPDPTLYEGSRSGYKAGVQRPTSDGFEDNRVAQDSSLALPAMELVLYNGDSSAGTARQFVHLAGVYAGASYGIACLYGKSEKGGCAKEGETGFVDNDPEPPAAPPASGETEYVEVEGPTSTEYLAAQERKSSKESLIERILKAPFRVASDVLRLLFSNPREFGLMAAVWALLFAPCYLGERRRSIRALRARQGALGGAVG